MELLKKAPGFTYSPLTKQQPDPGSRNYAVSPFKPRELVLDIDRLRPETIRKYAHDNRDLLYTDIKNNIGAWAEKGRVALDVSIVVKTQREARALCKKFDQDAYFSFKIMETVYVRKPRVLGGFAYAAGDQQEGDFRVSPWEDDEGGDIEDVYDADGEGADRERDQGIGGGDEVESGLTLTAKMRKDILDKVQRAIDSTLPQNLAEVTTTMKNVARTFTDQAVIARGFDFAGFPKGMDAFLNSYVPPLVDYTQGLIDKNTMDSIKKVLRDGVKNGIAPRELKDQIQAKFDNWTRSRPAVIARTEVGRIQVQTQIELIKERGDTKDIYLMWTTARDNRVRDSHMQVEDEVIQFGDTFSNGLRYPMDPEAPVEEVANCRCALVVLTPEMFDPLGIPKPQELRTVPKEELVPVSAPTAPVVPVESYKWKPVKKISEADTQIANLGFMRDSSLIATDPVHFMSVEAVNSVMPRLLENMQEYKIKAGRIQLRVEKGDARISAYANKGVGYKLTPEEYLRLSADPSLYGPDGHLFVDSVTNNPYFKDEAASRLTFNVASDKTAQKANFGLTKREMNAEWDEWSSSDQQYWWPVRKGDSGKTFDGFEMLTNHEFAHVIQGQTNEWGRTFSPLESNQRDFAANISKYSYKNLGELQAESLSTWMRIKDDPNLNLDAIMPTRAGAPSRFTYRDLKRFVEEFTDKPLYKSATESLFDNIPKSDIRPVESVPPEQLAEIVQRELEKFHIAIELSKEKGAKP